MYNAELYVVPVVLAVFGAFLVYGMPHVFRLHALYGRTSMWSHTGGLWDHPEPNYFVLPNVAEFWCTLTAIPVSASMLVVRSFAQGVSVRGRLLALICFFMYTAAFFSHSTLHPNLNAVTLSAVMTNAIYTFVAYGGVIQTLSPSAVRVPLAVALELLVFFLVITVPSWLKAYGTAYLGPVAVFGGVPALTLIQTPAVAIATVLALRQWRVCKPSERHIYKRLSAAGIVLCLAMAVSFGEIAYGLTRGVGVLDLAWILSSSSIVWDYVVVYNAMFVPLVKALSTVPIFHITIHTLEQIGIYLYVSGIFALDAQLAEAEAENKGRDD